MRRYALFAAAVAATAALAAGCGDRTADDSIQIVKAFYAAANAGDYDKAMSYVSPHAVFANPTGVYHGATEIRTQLSSSTDAEQELMNFRAVGGRVSYHFVVKSKSTGEEFDEGDDGLTIVRYRKIVFDGTERNEQYRPRR